jgi:signal transduction histidine kinase
MTFRRFVKENNVPYDYTVAGSVAEAKTLLASGKFDVVIADYLLGDGTAFEILDLKIDAPIIVITGSGSEEIAVKAMKAGASDYLIKDPENNHLKVLSHTVENALRLKRAEEERELLLNELEAKNTELEHFTYTVSHDLRSPLITILGFSDVAQEDLERDEKDKVKSDLEYIENAAIKMDILLNSTLQLSRIGRTVNPLEDVPFGEIVKDALEQTAGEIASEHIEVSIAEDFPTVHVDRMRIAEVLVNLIGNSIKYRGEQSSPRIEVGYRNRIEGKSKETVFFVRDNGMGIDKSKHEKVFDLFYTEDRSGKSTGAGLAIVKRIVEVHNGRIWIESEKGKGKGKGCTVCFTLPVV